MSLREPDWRRLIARGNHAALRIFCRAFPGLLSQRVPDAWWQALQHPHPHPLVEVLAKHDPDGAQRVADLQPLHRAVAQDHFQVLPLIASSLGDLEQRDAQGNTALMLAVLLGKEKSIDQLLALGAQPAPDPNGLGQDLATLALQSRDPALFLRLMRRGLGHTPERPGAWQRLVQGLGLTHWPLETWLAEGRRTQAQQAAQQLTQALPLAAAGGRERF